MEYTITQKQVDYLLSLYERAEMRAQGYASKSTIDAIAVMLEETPTNSEIAQLLYDLTNEIIEEDVQRMEWEYQNYPYEFREEAGS